MMPEVFDNSTRSAFARVLKISIPLMLATSGHALRLFADRAMLSQYAPEALAAAMPAGLTAFCLMAFFIGTAGYAGTFVAQYSGADQPHKTGAAIWQAIWIALVGGIAVGSTSWFAEQITGLMQHGAAVQAHQIPYYATLARWSFSAILLAALNAFWSGRGQTKVVMGIELFTAVLNIALNDALIFGKYGFPSLGITGAGLATGISSLGGCMIALTIFLRPQNRKKFGTWPEHLVDLPMLTRILRFGIPNGIQFSLELVAFNLFVIFLGRFGTAELEAANIAFGLNALAFLPLVGLGMAVSILVGQCIGARQTHLAKRYVSIAVKLSLGYNALIGVLMLAAPRLAIALFIREGDTEQAEALRLSILYMRFIVAYLVFDGIYIIYSHAIRGAGDTRFAMTAGLVLSWGTLAIPAWLLQRYSPTERPLWYLLVLHVVLAGLLFGWRYHQNKWTKMRVTEDLPVYEVDTHAEGGISG
jgi:multidrug resistance protein, MATE family